MKICAVADVHIGNHKRFGGPLVGGLNARCRMAIDVFHEAVKTADAWNAPLFVCGDLFDVARPAPPVVRAVMDVINAYRTVEVRIVLGNHDMHTNVGYDDAVSPLELLPNVRIHRADETFDICAGCIGSTLPYGSSDADPLPRLAERVSAEDEWKPLNKVDRHIIFGHFGVSDPNTPFFLQGSGGSISAEKALWGIKLWGINSSSIKRTLVVGDWHMEGDWKDGNANVIQCGALVPTGFDNPGHGYGSVVILDTTTSAFTRTRIPGPRFEKHSFEAFEDGDIVPNGNKTYVSFTAARKNKPAASEKIRELVRAGLIVDGAVAVDGEVQRVTAKAAALAAGSETSIREQVAAYVSKVSLPEGVTRDELLEGVMRHVGRT